MTILAQFVVDCIYAFVLFVSHLCMAVFIAETTNVVHHLEILFSPLQNL